MVRIVLFLMLCGAYGWSFSQGNYTVKWLENKPSQLGETPIQLMQCEACLQDASYLPLIQIPLPAGVWAKNPKIQIGQSEPISHEFINQIPGLEGITAHPKTEIVAGFSKKQGNYFVMVQPLFRASDGSIRRILTFTLQYESLPAPISKLGGEKSVTSSVLASGNWWKFGVTTTGMYRLTYESLVSNNVLSGPVSSASLKLHGNGGKLLPETAGTARPDDLLERAIDVVDGGDQSFGPGDYILFYATGPDHWYLDSANTKRFKHIKNIYSDTSYYFLTVRGNNGLRVGNAVNDAGTPDYTTSTYDDLILLEREEQNLEKSGKVWLGELFSFTNSYTYNGFGTVVTNDSSWVQVQVATRCVLCATNFRVQVNNVEIGTFVTGVSNPSYISPYARLTSFNTSFLPSNGNVNLSLSRTSPTQGGESSQAWLDYIELNLRKSLNFSGVPLLVHDYKAFNAGLAGYTISGYSGGTQIWDVSNAIEPVKRTPTVTGGNAYIQKANPKDTRLYVFGNIANLPEPTFIEQVTNQDLHALANESVSPELIIVTYPGFLSEAMRIADLHTFKDGMKVHVVTTTQVYNEFSSGSQDISAIRDFVKLYYDLHDADNIPKYLLLFGDGSYDYKTHLNRTPVDNTNFVPVYMTFDSFGRAGESYPSDDFYALLDDGEGGLGYISLGEILDIGVGRIPAGSLEEARGVVNKIIHYTENAACKKDWRNYVTLVADDMEDLWESQFVIGSEALSNQMGVKFPVWNMDKVYIDAYQQVTNAGQRYPEANQYLFNRANRGSLLINYIGHGGETGWTSERVFQIPEIMALENYDNLPLYATATCTFTRFDNPEFFSGGERLLLRNDGGGIALISTIRPISIVNTFNRKFFDATFTRKPDGTMPRLGDIILNSKRFPRDGGEYNILLFGDPAMQLAYPQFKVVTDSINGMIADSTALLDTAKASKMITISGHIADLDDAMLSSFNGVLYTTIFDKEASVQTLANDPKASPLNFTHRKNIIFKGQATIENGRFRFSFMVPLDINYLVGEGKISYYAENGSTDAHGYFNKLKVGSSEDNCTDDGVGPVVQLFLNDTNFLQNGIASSRPILIGRFFDPSGINTVGNGIGHDITLVIDGKTSQAISLNQFYEADLNSYQSGTLRFQLPELTPGVHKITVQVWDGCNNVSEQSLDFVVTDNALHIVNVTSYPNPFTTSTTISFEHNLGGKVANIEASIFDLSGRVIRTLSVSKNMSGFRETSLNWDGANADGGRVSNGVYFCRIRISNEQGTTVEGTTKIVYIGME